jgi:DNA-binding transcriptional LysR family regulator
MPLPALVTSPPPIEIAEEPLGDGAAPTAADALLSGDGFAIVPGWQARPPRRLRRLSVAVPIVAGVAAAALWIGRDDDARALRERLLLPPRRLLRARS